ncbi:MAG: hypothetical protein NC092_04550 [Butyrivibrio sp.]|nr:hypothetical protein [Muribaculum sp.]MCM1551944.1 hypothetical protein [Butyrivibrio sp.]
MDKKSVNIYIATSITGPRRGRGVYMYLLECFRANGETVTRQQAVEQEDATENQLAVCALEAALGRLTAECYLTIYTDCEYLYGTLENGMLEQWAARDWQNAKGAPVKYAEKWSRIRYLLVAQDVHMKLKEHHAYKRWMRDEIRKKSG